MCLYPAFHLPSQTFRDFATGLLCTLRLTGTDTRWQIVTDNKWTEAKCGEEAPYKERIASPGMAGRGSSSRADCQE